MKQLKVKDILNVIEYLEKDGLSKKEIENLPIYLGDDDELNGIHCGWYCQLVDETDDNHAELIEMINDDAQNIPFEDRAILIS